MTKHTDEAAKQEKKGGCRCNPCTCKDCRC